MSDPVANELIKKEFARAAAGFAERSAGRFDDMGVVAFARLTPGASVLEVGAGTGNFLTLFEEEASSLVAADLTHRMLVEARTRHPGLRLVQCDGARLPFPSGTFDLVASAQMFHHVWEPIPILREMRRVAGAEGRVLIVDQHATESYEQAAVMNRLEVIRDPSHAVSRPPSAFRVMLQAAGLDIVEERLWEGQSSFGKWMWPGEFPPERIEATERFVAEHGAATGMDWRREDGDWVFTRRRLMILAEAPRGVSGG